MFTRTSDVAQSKLEAGWGSFAPEFTGSLGASGHHAGVRHDLAAVPASEAQRHPIEQLAVLVTARESRLHALAIVRDLGEPELLDLDQNFIG